MNKNILIGTIPFLFGSILLGVGIMLYNISKHDPPLKLVIFDASYTSTYAYIFEWIDEKNHFSPKQINFVDCLGNMTHLTYDGKEKFLIECFEKINQKEKTIPHDTHIFIGGTGGMRLQCKDNMDECIQFRSELKDIIKKLGFPLNKNSVEILSEDMEALYGWLAANEYKNTFQNNLTTIGSIDLGESSLIIAYEINNNISEYNIVPVTFNGYLHHLVLNIIPCIGVSKIREYYEIMLLLHHVKKEPIVEDPCLPINKIIRKHISLFDLECTKDQYKDYKKLNNKTNVVVFKGTGVYSQCITNIEKFIPKSDKIFDSVKKIEYKDNKMKLLGISFLQKIFMLMDLDINPSLDDFKNRINSICYEKLINSTYGTECFYISYTYYLLEEILDIKVDQLIIINKEEKQINWPYGKAFSVKSIEKILHKRRMIGLTVFLSLLNFGLFFIFSSFFIMSNKHGSKGYTKLILDE